MGAWNHRIVKSEDGKLHFAYVRFRYLEDCISGATGIYNSGETVEDMRKLANELLHACDAGIIDMANGRDPDAENDDDDNDDDDDF